MIWVRAGGNGVVRGWLKLFPNESLVRRWGRCVTAWLNSLPNVSWRMLYVAIEVICRLKSLSKVTL